VTALDLDAEVCWADRTYSGYRACARIGDIYVVYLLLLDAAGKVGAWHAVTSAMTHKQAETYHPYAIEPVSTGPGLGAWLDREVAALTAAPRANPAALPA
jgi:hypothetical protein